MEEIECGEFLRLRGGKIVRYGEKQDIRVENNKYIDYSGEYEWETRIVKHGSIIDLIEVGDYVNGNKIIRIDKDPFIKGQINLWIGLYEMDSNGDRWRIKYTNNDIKSIVTKEQFENIEYKLDN